MTARIVAIVAIAAIPLGAGIAVAGATEAPTGLFDAWNGIHGGTEGVLRVGVLGLDPVPDFLRGCAVLVLEGLGNGDFAIGLAALGVAVVGL